MKKPKEPAPKNVPIPSDLTITVTKTSNGNHDYVQIMSRDMMSVNIVLIAARIEVDDRRSSPAEGREGLW